MPDGAWAKPWTVAEHARADARGVAQCLAHHGKNPEAVPHIDPADLAAPHLIGKLVLEVANDRRRPFRVEHEAEVLLR